MEFWNGSYSFLAGTTDGGFSAATTKASAGSKSSAEYRRSQKDGTIICWNSDIVDERVAARAVASSLPGFGFPV